MLCNKLSTKKQTMHTIIAFSPCETYVYAQAEEITPKNNNISIHGTI